MLQGAIVGLGNVALNGHLPAWLKSRDFRIAAGVDSSPERRDLFKKLHPSAQVFASLEECRDLPLDFVDVGTPPHTHAAIVRAALQKNLHVLCEKPLVLKESDLRELEQVRARSGRVLMTVHNWKYAPICKKISEIVSSGAIGKPFQCSWYVLRSGPSVTTEKDNWRLDPARAGGGILVDHGWHAFYLVLEWMQAVPKTVLAQLENRQYEDLPVEDTAKISIEFEGAGGKTPSAEVFLTWASRVRKNSGVIEGDSGRLQIEDDHLKLFLKGGTGAEPDETHRFPSALSQGSHHPEWFEDVLAEFSAELSDPARRGANFAAAGACLLLIERSKLSQEKKTKIAFAP